MLLTEYQVYITILASLPTIHMGLRPSVNKNLTDMIQLHDEILGCLHRVVPNSEYSQSDIQPPSIATAISRSRFQGHVHRRLLSLDSVPERRRDIAWLRRVPGMLSDPQVAAEVAKIFGKKVLFSV